MPTKNQICKDCVFSMSDYTDGYYYCLKKSVSVPPNASCSDFGFPYSMAAAMIVEEILDD